MDRTDEEILALMRRPETSERGFRLLMQCYQERLYGHIRRLVLDHDDANDVLQNCLIKVYRGIGSFEAKSKLYTWLYRIATNEAVTFLSRNRRRMVTPLEAGEQSVAGRLQADPYFNGDETRMRLQEAINRLPEKQRLVFNLRYYEEMSYPEISEVLSTSVGALKASYHHAVRKIEEHFRRSL